MENTFKVEFYPTDKDIQDIWKDSLIVFDTCSILNLYRYSESTRKQYLSVMKQVKERLWLPYQVGQEYFKNRLTTIISIGLSYDEIIRKLDDQFKEVQKSINTGFKFHEDDLKSLIEEIEGGFTKIKEAVENSKKSRIPFTIKDDPVLKEINVIYKNRVGESYTSEQISAINKEGEERYKNGVPPGYCDRNKDDVKKNKFGDLILWKQIIDKSLKDKKNIIFITDDAKEDWWLTIHGRTISPRKELYSEFLEKTKQKILIYRPDIFMKYAKDKFNSRLDDDAINEIINISTFISSYIKPNNPHNSDYLKYLLRLKNLQKLMPLDEKTLRDLISLEDYKSFINLKYHNNYTYLDEDSARLEAMLRSSVKIEDYIRSIQNESKKGNQNSPKDDESEDDDLEEKRSKED